VPLGLINNAIMLGMSCDTGEDAKRRDAAATVELAGIAASRGVYWGRARVVTAPADFWRLVHGDVLVAPMATPDPVSGAPDYWVIEFGTR
jgi:phosphoenolpyruvate synthase/pyruvate phosphate dikinase